MNGRRTGDGRTDGRTNSLHNINDSQRREQRDHPLLFFHPINISKHFHFALSDTCADAPALRLRMGPPVLLSAAQSHTLAASSGPRIKAHTCTHTHTLTHTHTKPPLCDDRVLRTYPQSCQENKKQKSTDIVL